MAGQAGALTHFEVLSFRVKVQCPKCGRREWVWGNPRENHFPVNVECIPCQTWFPVPSLKAAIRSFERDPLGEGNGRRVL